jgi:hypothetical protein
MQHFRQKTNYPGMSEFERIHAQLMVGFRRGDIAQFDFELGQSLMLAKVHLGRVV